MLGYSTTYTASSTTATPITPYSEDGHLKGIVMQFPPKNSVRAQAPTENAPGPPTTKNRAYKPHIGVCVGENLSQRQILITTFGLCFVERGNRLLVEFLWLFSHNPSFQSNAASYV